MDPKNSAQDLVRCHLCEKPFPLYFCEHCDTNLCPSCAGKHLLDGSTVHKVLSIKHRWSGYPNCSIHCIKRNELYCKQCHIPICVQCACSTEHRGHIFTDVLKEIELKKKKMKEKLQELEETIYPRYKEVASNLQDLKENLIENEKELAKDLEKQGEQWIKAIYSIIQKMQSEISDKSSKSKAEICTYQHQISETMVKISYSVKVLRYLLSDSTDDFLVFSHSETEISDLPPHFAVNLPNFSPMNLNNVDLECLFGSLSNFSMETTKFFMDTRL